MKKWMMMVLIGAVTTGIAVAEEAKAPWYKRLFGMSADEQAQVVPPAPAVSAPVPAPTKEMPRMQRPDGKVEGKRPQIAPEQMEKMKAQREALMKLGEAARNETDPAKKEALVAQLRTKLTADADKRLEELKKRVEQADQEMPKLKERLADAEKNKATRIEEQVQRILKGEPLKNPEGKRPEGAAPKKEGKKPATPAVTQ
ncbi:MAG: hypothetical protein HOO88_02525 [Kiritimatiellaceae bacterium]|nr:hypothetical protein [Kiritimatiellaceae bacterium]